MKSVFCTLMLLNIITETTANTKTRITSKERAAEHLVEYSLNRNESITLYTSYLSTDGSPKADLLHKRPALLDHKSVILWHDKVHTHMAAIMVNININGINWEFLQYPLYSAGLASSNDHLFRSLKYFLGGRQSHSIQNFFLIENSPSRWQSGIITVEITFCTKLNSWM